MGGEKGGGRMPVNSLSSIMLYVGLWSMFAEITTLVQMEYLQDPWGRKED